MGEVESKVEGKAKEVRRISGLDAIPRVGKREFKFKQGGEEFSIEYTPLTAEQAEDVRARISAPIPPQKPIKGLSARDLEYRRREGLPVTASDPEDPDFIEADKRYQQEITMEMVRVALGWDVERGEFAKALRTRLTQGVYSRLISDITSATFQIDSGLIERFLANLAPGTTEIAGS